MWVRNLSTLECTNLLARNRVGHLACAKDGRPYVVPIHFAYASNNLYAFSLPGRKIEFMRANPLVSLVVQERGLGKGWRSVIVDGRYEELQDRIGYKVERDHAWSLLSRHADWWQPGGLKPGAPSPTDPAQPVFFRIAVEEISGREAKDVD